MFVTVYTDGASRGNPGPAAAAYRILRDGHPTIAHGQIIGTATNNGAEYTAVILALTRAQQIGATRIKLHSDSELIVKQMRGEYRVKHPDIQPLYEEAKALERQFAQIEYAYIPRSENAEADQLCNDALDGETKRVRHHVETIGNVDEQIHDLLSDAIVAWSKGQGPKPDELWTQIQSVLIKAGRITKPGKPAARKPGGYRRQK